MAERKLPAGTIFAGLCVVAAMAITGVIGWAMVRAERSGATPVVATLAATAIAAVEGSSDIYFRYTGLGSHYGRLAAATNAAGEPEVVFYDDLSCEAVYVAAGRGVCLSADRGVVTTYSAKLFDTTTHRAHASIPLAGVPSRTRVSADGSIAATTVFVTGHGYDSVDFSTQTLLLDLDRAETVVDLETFTVIENGGIISQPDFNFWGVTFTPDGRGFYATLSTRGRHVLVRGDIAARRVEVIHENVECPSLSQDGTRVAYKRRFVVGGRIGWELHVLDLATRREIPLAEQRSIDDQLEWLDDSRVLYSVASGGAGSAATDIWIANADGSGEPSLFLPTAYSPSVVR